jgi:hypothetical protein
LTATTQCRNPGIDADRIRAELAEMIEAFNDDPPACPVARLLALDEIGRLRAALREAEGRGP